MTGYNLIEALEAIDPKDLDYQGWCEVGMALHYEGYDSSVWRDWSMRDMARFNEKDFQTKWRSFGENTGNPVTGGTIAKMAIDRGWQPRNRKPHKALDWDSVIGGDEDEPVIVDAASVGDYDEEVKPMYPPGNEAAELITYLEALFEPSDYVGYVTDYVEEVMEDGSIKRKPGSRGIYSRTMESIRSSLENNTIENALSSTLHDKSGAWIRFNPLDGAGVGNDNVTAFRYALLESDDMPQGKFASIVKQLNLPVAAMVDSAGKSLHAIVRIDAEDRKQYAERVSTLFARCEKNGIVVDKANKNPSRLSRMPGVSRSGKRQFLAGLSQGAADWEEWDEWYEAETDDLPDADPFDIDLDGERPELNPALIEGVLRVKDKMLLAGPSKAGKSFLLTELCAAFANGTTWLGFQCRKSKVLYVNLEITVKSTKVRFYDVFNALGLRNIDMVVPWNLKGHGKPLAHLKKALIRRIKKNNVEVVIIDPIYKVMMGDENNARDISEFTNALDSIIEEAGVSIIYCHHHSKGSQAGKRSIDRASGSGVFGRDADAIVDMIELEVDSSAKWKRIQDDICRECELTMIDHGLGKDWAELPETTRKIEKNALLTACEWLNGADAAELNARCDKIREKEVAITAWRIEGTLREFAAFKPVNIWFDHPIHEIDPMLNDYKEVGSEDNVQGSGSSGKGRQKVTRHDKINEAIEYGVNACNDDGVAPTRRNVFDRMQKVDGKKVSFESFRDWTKPSKNQWCKWVNNLDGTEQGESGSIVKRPKNG